jgi:hypothetical protein
VTVWLPGMGEKKTCKIAPLQPNETMQNTGFDIAATTGDNPIIAIAYIAIAAANGLNPRTSHLYVSTVDPTTCYSSLKTRSDF